MIKNKNIIIKSISAKDTYSVRHPILRKGRPIEDCEFDGDELESTIHIGVYFKNKLIGVTTFLKQTNTLFKDDNQFQLRGMAILEEEQAHGFGELLLKEGEQLLIGRKVNRIWCHARQTATNFYKKNEYQIIGKSFLIPKIGLHYTMTKKI